MLPRFRRTALLAGFAALGIVGGSAAPGIVGPPALDGPTGAGAALAAGATRAPGSDRVVAASPRPWWRDRVFLEIYVRSFQDSDGDGIGDLRGLTRRLDDIAALGVDALWLMPVTASDTEHGYATTDYRAVEPDYGTIEDFRTFIAAAHARDIRVIIDFVANHTSSAHPWFRSALGGPRSPRRSWYRFSAADPGQPGPYGRAWHPAPGGGWYFGLFGSGQPDLDLTNPAVTRELTDAARFWLDQGVDGFRLDAAKHLIERGTQFEGTDATLRWLAAFRASVRRHRPDALVLGEVWSPTAAVARYTAGSLDLAFGFDLARGMTKSVRDGDGLELVVELALAEQLMPGRTASFLSNHDQPRIASAVGALAGRPDHESLTRLAAAVLLTAPGVPFLWAGEETGTLGTKPDEQIRLPIAWDTSPGGGFTTGTPFRPLPEDAAVRNVATQRSDPASTWNAYRELIALRRSIVALRDGGVAMVRSPTPGIAAWLRPAPGDTPNGLARAGTVLVVHNLGSRPARPVLGAPGGVPPGRAEIRWGPGAGTSARSPEPDAAGAVTAWAPVDELGARQSLVIELGRPG